MGSGASVVEETVESLNSEGHKTGLIKVRLYRPFDSKAFLSSIPKTCKRIAVLERTKEPGAIGEPLYLDVCATLLEGNQGSIEVVGGRYGLSSKEFSPSHVYAVFQNLSSATPKNHFTVGIDDDLTNTSLRISEKYDTENED